MVSGHVADETGKSLPGVSVFLKGTRLGTTTDEAGHFSLRLGNVKARPILVFSSVGYIPLALQVSDVTMNVTLSHSQDTLGNVVVVAYGTQKKENLTGAVSTVTARDLESRPATTVTQALQGAAPNLIIQQNISEPGAPININIRGVGTLGSASPLVIIDGIEGSLDALNPNDIESISVLKDAASAAIYGSRSSNGVILVTTKKGKKNSRTVVTYNGIAGLQLPTFQLKPVSGYQYMQLKNEALVNSGMFPQFSPEQVIAQYKKGSYPWWMDEVIKPSAPQQNHNLSISGSSGNTSYFLSGGYMDQSSMFQGPNYGLKRYNLRSNINSQISTWLKISGIFSFSRSDIRENAYYDQWIVSTAARIPRIYPIRDSAGHYFIAPTASNNPLAQLEQGGLRQYQNNNFNFNLNAEISVTSHLGVKLLYGGDYAIGRMNEFRKAIDYSPYVGSDNQSANTDLNTNTRHSNFQALLNYNNLFSGRHSIKALVGYSSEGYLTGNSQLQQLFVDNVTGQPVTATTVNVNNSWNLRTDQWALNSVFGRANYAYDDKYLFEFDFRVDASSRFAPANRRAFFPSFSAGWKLTDETFMQGVKDNIGNLKIRGSWGRLGNQEIGLYSYLNTLYTRPNTYGFNNQGQAGSFYSVGNPDIRWETSTMGDIGLDAALLNNRLTVSWDYFRKMTTGILLSLPAPSLFGATPPTQNAAKVENQGWELAVSYRLRTGTFNHSFAFNIADNLNTVKDTHGQEFLVEADRTFITKEGYPISSYYGLQSDGFYQSQSEIDKGPRSAFVNQLKPGDIKYVDRNKDGVIDNKDRYVMGNPFPRYTFGFTYTAAWNGFDATIFFQGVGKRSLYLRGEGVEAFHNNWDDVYQEHLDRWTPAHPYAKYPRLTIGTESTNTEQGSDFWLLNAAYARLKNIQLGYTIPSKLIKKAGIEKIRVYFTGQNLFTFTKMNNGFDPEISELNNSLRISHTDSNSGRVYPNVKVVAFGLDINF
jgi:TonB-linked SusC/RagA family outer membrane protein